MGLFEVISIFGSSQKWAGFIVLMNVHARLFGYEWLDPNFY